MSWHIKIYIYLKLLNCSITPFLDLYFVELYTSILQATVRSLVTLAEAGGCDPDQVSTLVSSLADLEGGYSAVSQQSGDTEARGSSPASLPSAASRGGSGRNSVLSISSGSGSHDQRDPLGLSQLSVLSGMTWRLEEESRLRSVLK